MAPEVVAIGSCKNYDGDDYTEKVDIFSFGMMLYELMCLESPFREFSSPLSITEAVTCYCSAASLFSCLICVTVEQIR